MRLWRKKVEGLSAEQLREAAEAIGEEIRRQMAMGPIEREVAHHMRYGYATFDDVRQSLLILARAMDEVKK